MQNRSPILFTALALCAAACSQQDKKPRLAEAAVVGLWRSDTLPAADAGGRIYRLEMLSGGTAEFTTEFVGKSTITERGTWDGADSLVRIVVRGSATASRPTSLLLAIRGNALGLVQFDTTLWGPAGLTLTRR
ncbi:MAG: hypothetical protein U5K74_16190 [Gemmatimonadaceae bacterium]|nr:hypothetical protein [Gemmatimonadaceae bacterium]